MKQEQRIIDLKKKILELYNNGLSSAKVGKLVGLTRETILYHLKKLEKETGQKIIRSVSETNKDLNRKHNLDQTFFEKIDTQEKAYILGFLYGDGYNNEKRGRIEINLSCIDEDILLKIKDCIKYDGELLRLAAYQHKEAKFISAPKTCLRFQCRKVSQDLVKLGMKQGKSLTLEFPTTDIVPEHLFRHFLRGLFDSDGDISFTKKKKNITCGIVSSKQFILKLKYKLEQIFQFHFGIRDLDKVDYLQLCGNNQCKIFMEYLYKDASIYMNRKYDTYNKLYTFVKDNFIDIKKSVIQFDKNGIEIARFKSCSEAGRIMKVHNSNIYRCANKETQNCAGFIWKFENE